MNNRENRAPDSKPAQVRMPRADPRLTLPEQTHSCNQTKKCSNIFRSQEPWNTHSACACLSHCIVSSRCSSHSHYLSRAALHPDVANSTIAARKHDPGLRYQFCLRILHQLLTLLSTSAFSPSLCWMENLSPSGYMLAPSIILPLLPQFRWNGKALL